MLSLSHVRPYSNLVKMNNPVNFQSRKYLTNTIVKTKKIEQIAKLSDAVKIALLEIKLSRIHQQKKIGSYITDLKPSIVYDHAINMLESENPGVRNLSIDLFIDAAVKGNLDALNKVASLVLNKDLELKECPQEVAMKWIMESTKHGNANAWMLLGLHTLKGNGVEQDIEKALECFNTAHDIGHQDAFKHILFVREILRSEDPKRAALTLSLEYNNTSRE